MIVNNGVDVTVTRGEEYRPETDFNSTVPIFLCQRMSTDTCNVTGCC